MNTAVHIMQAVNWGKYDLQGWLRQFGLWQASTVGGFSDTNPIAVAMCKAKLKVHKMNTAKLIALYMCDDEYTERYKKEKQVCEICDDEARAVQKLIIDVIESAQYAKSEALIEWMNAIIARYFHLRSWSEMQTELRTSMEAKYDVRCGLAVLHVRYPFIHYEKGTV